MAQLIRKQVAFFVEMSGPLLFGVVLALVWANLDPAGYQHMVHWSPFGGDSALTLHFLVNDVFMALFFGLAMKEITEACMPGGALNSIRKAVNPLVGTVGGVLGPIAVFMAVVWSSGDASIARGWGVPTATDIALAWLVARLAFGKGHPGVSFLLLLAVADDGIGLLIIAVFYPDPAHPVSPGYFGIVVVASALAYTFRRVKIKGFAWYLMGPGVIAWMGLHLAHLHPALALVFVVPFMPSAKTDLGLFDVRELERGDTLSRFEHSMKLPVDLGLLVFGLVNAGVTIGAVGNATYAVFLALVVGKTTGIFLASYGAHRLGFQLPEGLSPAGLAVAGLIAALGLTVALFVAGVAFTDPELQSAAKLGALLSVAVAPVAVLVGRRVRVTEGRTRTQPAPVAQLGLRPSLVPIACAGQSSSVTVDS